jgi:hypothetical protein
MAGGELEAGRVGDQRHQLRFGEPGEPDAPDARLGREPGQRVGQGRRDLRVAVGADQQQVPAVPARGEERQQLERPWVRPLEIIEDEDQRPRGRGPEQEAS